MKRVEYPDMIPENFYLAYYPISRVVLKYKLKVKYDEYVGISSYYTSVSQGPDVESLPQEGTISNAGRYAIYYELNKEEIESAIIEVI